MWVVCKSSQGSFFSLFLSASMINDEPISSVRGSVKYKKWKCHVNFYGFKLSNWIKRKLKLSLEITWLCHYTENDGNMTEWTFKIFLIRAFWVFFNQTDFVFRANTFFLQFSIRGISQLRLKPNLRWQLFSKYFSSTQRLRTWVKFLENWISIFFCCKTFFFSCTDWDSVADDICLCLCSGLPQVTGCRLHMSDMSKDSYRFQNMQLRAQAGAQFAASAAVLYNTGYRTLVSCIVNN